MQMQSYPSIYLTLIALLFFAFASLAGVSLFVLYLTIWVEKRASVALDFAVPLVLYSFRAQMFGGLANMNRVFFPSFCDATTLKRRREK